MPRPANRIDIYLPLFHNDGRRIAESKFADLEDELTNRFGGATSNQAAAAFRGPALGANSFGRDAEAYRHPAQQYFLFGEGRWEFPLLNGRIVVARGEYLRD